MLLWLHTTGRAAFLFCFGVWDRVSLCSRRLELSDVNQVGFEFVGTSMALPPECRDNKACTTTTRLRLGHSQWSEMRLAYGSGGWKVLVDKRGQEGINLDFLTNPLQGAHSSSDQSVVALSSRFQTSPSRLLFPILWLQGPSFQHMAFVVHIQTGTIPEHCFHQEWRKYISINQRLMSYLWLIYWNRFGSWLPTEPQWSHY